MWVWFLDAFVLDGVSKASCDYWVGAKITSEALHCLWYSVAHV